MVAVAAARRRALADVAAEDQLAAPGQWTSGIRGESVLPFCASV